MTPFDGGPVYSPDAQCRERRQVSAKWFFGDGKGLDSNHPLTAELDGCFRRDDFKKRCKDGLKSVVKIVAKGIENKCKSEGWQVTGLGVSVPATWTHDEQDEYKALLKGAFTSKTIQQVLGRNLYFHTEVEAFAHYLMHNARSYRNIFPKTADITILGLDLGGFRMSGCPLGARGSPRGDAAAFFRLGDPFGAGGGTEHWEAYISEFCTGETLKTDGPDREKSFPGETLRGKLLENIHQQITESDIETFQEMRLHANISDSIPVIVPESVVKVTFEAAMKAPLDVAHEHINDLGQLYEPCGIQMLQRDVPKHGSGGRVASNNEAWDDTAAILFNQEHRSADITTSGTDRLKIICDPFHGRGNKSGSLLAHDRCYDVVELSIPKKGTWRSTVDSVRQGRDGERMFLQLSRRRLGEVSTEETQTLPALQLELYFDRTANCYLIYDGNGEIGDAHPGLALTDDNQLVACSNATTLPQVEEAAPVPGGTPQAKRMMKRTRQMAPMARLPFTPTKRAKSVATSSGTNDTPSYEEARENPVNGMSVSALLN
ncbi:hypothetical protein CGLO_03826 [Colletotrichum gloeosporioides Cg-14]|uniref:Uncharacterized protein n=1 Tax=Colletotrichum gloeosporioides (strain Cg-14) TaxID=1237896 RepID=T0KU43_COLGC|nr:hypothetical protein CGLO_03826 [Colletotrichum gloeosporioides Cg-14]